MEANTDVAPTSTPSTSDSQTEPEIDNANSVGPASPEQIGYLDPSILKWNLGNWKRLSSEEKEDILFQFWVKTSSDKFPHTMNLILSPHPVTTCALAGFMLLFSEGTSIYKQGVYWTTDEVGRRVDIKLVWSDPSGTSKRWKHQVLGKG